MAEAGQEGLVRSSLWRIHAQLYREKSSAEIPHPRALYLLPWMHRSRAWRLPSLITRQETQTEVQLSLSQSNMCTKQCPHHHEFRHQLLLLASSVVCFSAMLVTIKATPCLQSPIEGHFPSSVPVLQLLLADLAQPTNIPHQQVQARDAGAIKQMSTWGLSHYRDGSRGSRTTLMTH